MKVSLNWLKQYLNLDGLSPEKVGEILTDIGLEVESIERTESIKGGLAGVVVGHVVEREKHPNADRLNVCQVDVGEEQPRGIVCGARNFAEGDLIVAALPGVVLPGPFEIRMPVRTWKSNRRSASGRSPSRERQAMPVALQCWSSSAFGTPQ